MLVDADVHYTTPYSVRGVVPLERPRPNGTRSRHQAWGGLVLQASRFSIAGVSMYTQDWPLEVSFRLLRSDFVFNLPEIRVELSQA